MSSSIPRSTSLDVVQEIIREAETYLGAQLTAGIAADQRAIAFTSVVAAAAVIVITAGAGLLMAENADPLLGWIGIGLGVFLIAAMGFAILSAMPATFEFAGNSPENWVDDLGSGVSLEHALAEQADHYAAMINENGRLLRRNARQLRAAVWIAWAGLLVGALLVGLRIAYAG